MCNGLSEEVIVNYFTYIAHSRAIVQDRSKDYALSYSREFNLLVKNCLTFLNSPGKLIPLFGLIVPTVRLPARRDLPRSNRRGFRGPADRRIFNPSGMA
jgi:hypothetical protein